MKRFTHPLLRAVALAASLCAGTLHAAAPSSEKTALLALYSDSGGAWANEYGWSTPDQVPDACNWGRVTCAGPLGSEHVVGLDLHFNALSGNKQLDFTKLTKLQTLNLESNNLTGAFPNVAGLTELTRLVLRGNALTGTIPDLAALGLTKLEYVSLYNNEFTGSTPDLGGLPLLKVFYASGNKLNGVIGPLAGAEALEEFEAQNNRTAQDNTGLTGSIPSLAGLTKLVKFNVGNNRLDGITDLAGHPVLSEFIASRNQLSGPIPPLTDLPQLYSLYLDDNALTGPIPELTGLNNLEYLYLQFNQLTGKIPDSLTGLAKLAHFQIQNNQLVGAPPRPPASLASSAAMCPNPLRNSKDDSINAAWDPITGTGDLPWGTGCTGSSDVTPIIYDAAGNEVKDGSTGTVSPGDTQILPNNSAPFSFALEPAPGYRLRPDVPSNCAKSELNGFTFSVSKLTGNCNFQVTFVPELAPGDEDGQCGGDHDHVLTSPPVNLCSAGAASTVTFDSATGEWHWSCAGTGATGAAAQCYAAKSGASLSLTVTAAAAGPGTAAPTTQTVNSGERAIVTATPSANSHLASVSGCGATFAGNTVTTAPVTDDCTVTLSFADGPAPAAQPVPTLDQWTLALLAALVLMAGVRMRRVE